MYLYVYIDIPIYLYTYIDIPIYLYCMSTQLRRPRFPSEPKRGGGMREAFIYYKNK